MAKSADRIYDDFFNALDELMEHLDNEPGGSTDDKAKEVVKQSDTFRDKLEEFTSWDWEKALEE